MQGAHHADGDRRATAQAEGRPDGDGLLADLELGGAPQFGDREGAAFDLQSAGNLAVAAAGAFKSFSSAAEAAATTGEFGRARSGELALRASGKLPAAIASGQRDGADRGCGIEPERDEPPGRLRRTAATGDDRCGGNAQLWSGNIRHAAARDASTRAALLSFARNPSSRFARKSVNSIASARCAMSP